MPRLDRWHLLALLAAALLAAGCRREEAKKTPAAGVVHASAAYRTWFGEPPAVAAGECYALAGFSPLAAEPALVTPFPLFLVARENRLQLVTRQLLQWGPGWNGGGVANPFPPGTALVSLEQKGDQVRLELSAEVLSQSDPARQQAILSALGHTLAQFEGVSRVLATVGGSPLFGLAAAGFVPDPATVAEPGEPHPLEVAGIWEQGQAHPGEVSLFFDRPVAVERVSLADEAGRPLEGEYYRSVFDMAVVLRPRVPAVIREGMAVRVGWRVVDPLGRKGEGERTFYLARREHP